MLIDDIAALTERIGKLRGLQSIASEAERFETRATQIEKLASDLSSPVGIIELLRAHGIEVSVPAPPTGLMRLAESMKRPLEQDRASTLSDMDGFGQKFKSPLEGFCARLSAAGTSAWEEHVDRNAPSVNSEMLSVLTALKGFADSVSAVRRCVTQYEAQRTRTPTSVDDIRSFNTVLKALQDALGSLGSNDLPEEIVNFIRRAGLQGVPLDQLTPKTLDWLREQDLLGQFVVKTA